MVSLLLLAMPAQAADAAPTQPAKPVRVACCGDSITCGAGTAVPERDAYPKQLAALLGAGWEVQSFGVSGTTVFNITGNPWAGHPERDAALASKPDVVIIALGTNDCNPEKWKNKDQYLKDYRALIQMFRKLESKPKIYVATPVPFGPAQNDHLPGLKEQIVLIGQLAEEEKLTIIDMNAAMKGREDLIPDSVHPNTTGAGIMARTAFKALTGNEAPSPASNPVPAGFVRIPAGEFSMGDALDGIPGAPVHKVTLSAFYMAKSLVTQAEWNEVVTWASTHGYQDLAAKEGKATDHPVHTVSWYDAVKWCNARSEKEGLTPCYTVNGAVMKTGAAEPAVNWATTGYRLPTEAEWEKAARGGLSGKRFPWGDTISHSQANFTNDGGEAYATGATGPHPLWGKNDDPNCPHTSPVGSFPANGYGLLDMAGNVWQRCWDWYSWEPGPATDPRGVATGTIRTLRGGSWRVGAESCRVAFRNSGDPAYASRYVGFRVARSDCQN